jgi:transcriptional regulator with XRE-family HTH domain
VTYTRDLRRHLGVTRAALGRFLGVSEPTLVRWELSDEGHVLRGLPLVLGLEVERALGRGELARVREIVRDGPAADHARAICDLVALARGSPRTIVPKERRRRP